MTLVSAASPVVQAPGWLPSICLSSGGWDPLKHKKYKRSYRSRFRGAAPMTPPSKIFFALQKNQFNFFDVRFSSMMLSIIKKREVHNVKEKYTKAIMEMIENMTAEQVKFIYLFTQLLFVQDND